MDSPGLVNPYWANVITSFSQYLETISDCRVIQDDSGGVGGLRRIDRLYLLRVYCVPGPMLEVTLSSHE